jgi:hypothetical protein
MMRVLTILIRVLGIQFPLEVIENALSVVLDFRSEGSILAGNDFGGE